MRSNGDRNDTRSEIELLTPARSAGEAAAIVAAIEQFIGETTPVASEKPAGSAWQRAALEEGIAARQVTGYAWGHSPPKP
ncbi:hypothetical protein BH10ACT11_BH10ACT11_01180 [soil metagenome]